MKKSTVKNLNMMNVQTLTNTDLCAINGGVAAASPALVITYVQGVLNPVTNTVTSVITINNIVPVVTDILNNASLGAVTGGILGGGILGGGKII